MKKNKTKNFNEGKYVMPDELNRLYTHISKKKDYTFTQQLLDEEEFFKKKIKDNILLNTKYQ